MNEAETRAEHIDPSLKAAGWGVVLSHYISVGVEELDQQKLTPLLRLKYGAIQDAVADLGQPEEIGKTFAGFQKYLYTEKVA